MLRHTSSRIALVVLSAVLLGVAVAQAAPPRPDFNGDGKPDILLRHSTEGLLAVWFMDGVNMTGAALLNPSNIDDPDWQVAGVADFNGDLKPDLLWRHATQGLLAVWYLDGINLTGASLLNPSGIADLAWRLEGTADFNGDNKPDLVWRHATQGLLAAWLMDGVNLTAASLFNPSAIDDLTWKIAGFADFNNDNKTDIVWRHDTQNTLAVWMLDGLNLSSAALLSPPAVTDSNWLIAGFADYNGDGKTDVLWRHATNGAMAAWLMNGVTLTSASATNPPSLGDNNWLIVGQPRPTTYSVVSIEPVNGRTRTRALGINNNGQVVGRAANFNSTEQIETDKQAILWDAISGVRALPTLSGAASAWDINDSGLASGDSTLASGMTHAVRWDTSASTITDLGTLVNPTTSVAGNNSAGNCINAAGVVVGDSDIPNTAGTFSPFHAFRRAPGSAMQDLGTLDTSYPDSQFGYSIAYDINGLGQVVGIANTTTSGAFSYVAFIYDAAGGMRALPSDPAHATVTDEWNAVAINNAGMIAGHVLVGTDQSLPYYWPNATASPVAVPLPTAYPYGEVYSVNSQGVMVGVMWNALGEERAFVFDVARGVRDLNSLIPSGSGWVLEFARDINDYGQIVGGGTITAAKRGFVLKPKF
jgi:probable HAF family extracellular repeat protein